MLFRSQGLLFPANTPKPSVERMQREVAKVLGDAETATRLRDLGYEPVGSTPQESSAYIKAELVKWEKVIKATHVKPE